MLVGLIIGILAMGTFGYYYGDTAEYYKELPNGNQLKTTCEIVDNGLDCYDFTITDKDGNEVR